MGIKKALLTYSRYGLTVLGPWTSRSIIHLFNAGLNYLEVGRWMAEQGYHLQDRHQRRTELFDLVGKEIGEERVLYLEFGVYKGDSMRHWSSVLKNPKARLHGFDSFEGLPEGWIYGTEKSHFSTNGSVPSIDDPRVTFYQGWFDQVLPTYIPPEHDRLILNLDADLYSSTAYVLRHFAPHVRPGDYLYFDEFSSREHELRAFDEFLKDTRAIFKIRGADKTLTHVLFQCVENPTDAC